jgi:beta-lactamase class A
LTWAREAPRQNDPQAWVHSAFEEANAAYPGIVRSSAAVVHDLQHGRNEGWNASADIYPASVVKVPIMVEVFRRYAEATLAPDTVVEIDARNQTATSGPAPFVPGYRASVQELVDLMIAHSDNVATNQLMDLLRRERVTDAMRALGLQTFFLGRKLSGSEPLIDDPDEAGRNRLPASEIALLLEAIARGTVPGSKQQQRILALCVDDAKLAAGLLPGDVFMHKTGETSQVSHDAGILVTADARRYIVVLYTLVEPTPDNADATHANPFMAHWMRVIRRYL